MTSPEAWSPPPRFALRPPWSPRSVAFAGLMLEATVLLAFVAVAAGGVFRGEDGDTMPLPIPLGLRDVPALVVVGAFVALRGHARTWLAHDPRIPTKLRGLAPFIPFATLVTALGAAAHPDPERGLVLSILSGLGVGLVVSVFAMPMAEFARALEADEARPWRELHVAATLATLGTLASAARGGVLVSAPTVAFGVVMLGRGLFQDVVDLVRARTSCFGAAMRLVLGVTLLLLGVGLLVVSSAMSLGLARVPTR